MRLGTFRRQVVPQENLKDWEEAEEYFMVLVALDDDDKGGINC